MRPPNGEDAKPVEEQRSEVEAIKRRFEAMKAAGTPTPPTCPPDVLESMRAGAEREKEMVKAREHSRRPPPPRVMTGDKPRNRGAWDEADAQAATQGDGHDPTDRTVSPGTEVSAALGAIEDVILAEPAINYPDPTVAMFRARGLATAAGLNELARRKLFPDSPPRDLQAVMKQALVDAGLLPSPLVVDVLDHHVYDLADRPQREFVKLKPGEPDPGWFAGPCPPPGYRLESPAEYRARLTAPGAEPPDEPRISIPDLRMGGTLHPSDPDPVMLSFKPPPTFETPDGTPARISLVNAPKWEAVAERARKAGIEPDWSLCGALWLALDKFESAERARKTEFEKRCKAVAREARTGTKLGEARKASSAATTWLREQAADIDPDLPVAELDEAQLRGVVGVELLRLRRELEVARAESEANNARIGEVVAERAALRRELDAARVTNQLLAYPGRDDEGRLLKPGHVIEADDADRWGLNDREYLLFRLGQRGAKGADVAGAGVHRLAYLLDVAEGNRRDGPAMPSIEAQREALVAANPPPRSPFTPEQERAIGSLVGRVTVQPRGQPSRWEAFVDGVLDVPEVVFAASEQSAKNLACVVIARKRWPDLWPETA